MAIVLKIDVNFMQLAKPTIKHIFSHFDNLHRQEGMQRDAHNP